MKVKPLRNYILVQLLNDNEWDGLESVDEKMFKVRGEVLDKGVEVSEDIEVGDVVLFEDYGRVKIPGEEEIALIKQDGVVAKYVK